MDSSAETHDKQNQEEEEEEEENEDETYSFAMQLAMSITLPVAMQAAAELGVFEIIAKAGPRGKLSAAEIAAQTPSRNPEAALMLDRILRLLASHCVLRCSLSAGDDQRLYSLAPVAKYFVLNRDGVSLCPLMALTADQANQNVWFKLRDAIVGGVTPFRIVHGMDLFEYMGSDSRFNEVFNRAMFNHTSIVMNRILDSYKGFEQIKKLVDVGGGTGITLNIIASKYPHFKGVNFDLPNVIQDAPSYPGVEHIGGDMFKRIPKGDAILLKEILHNWGDEHCLSLLRNCYEAIPVNGRIIIMDRVPLAMPEATPAARESSMMDVIMLMQFSGGKERTKQELMALASHAGFRGLNYECFVCSYCILEFIK